MSPEEIDMERENTTPTEPDVDWQAVGAAFSDLVTLGLHALAWWMSVQQAATSEPPPATTIDHEDRQVEEAAALLGVSVDATLDEIRAALRARLAAARLHPDQGGDGEEATRLISAKNLLIERARQVRP